MHGNDDRCVPTLLSLNGMGLELTFTCAGTQPTIELVLGSISHNFHLLEKVDVLRCPWCYIRVLSLETKDIRTSQTTTFS